MGDVPAPLQGDEFERAARLFAFTGQTPVQVAAAALAQEQSPCAPASAQPRHPLWTSARKRLAAASVSIGAMSVVGLLAVGLTTPAAALSASADLKADVATTSPSAAASADGEEIQAFVASSTVHDVTLERTESYSTATMADLAAASGVRNFDNSFISNPSSPVQWPFPVGVPYTWGFQMRDGSMHHGVDFVPGQGAEIHAIADGTVRIATESGGLYGVHVVVDHEINGELVSSHYAHMEYGSLRVSTGDTVKAGDVLGTVGDTGYSFGAHLHFEVWQNGTTKVDPLEWMYQHTVG
ncbi:M23 family metallopeptidase [Microbacterium sp. zg-YB36]|uniref:M23 family metallopeptidase n=1 Tax=Microbacterium sp. zg-YB36 TaxID=2969407 RepID=UPI00214B5C3F|nr:M23 family metallopeptidase [Microbacterium sp. zg-YB36]MDL5351433.1 M23 family metallopeptidase [Microbacterium sp. zg-YB36]